MHKAILHFAFEFLGKDALSFPKLGGLYIMFLWIVFVVIMQRPIAHFAERRDALQF